MENLNIVYTEQELRMLVERFGIKDQAKRELRGNTDEERTEILKRALSDSATGGEYWVAFNLDLEDIPMHLAEDGINDGSRTILQWRLEIGK